MSHDPIQILFLGELPVWLKIAQALVDAQGVSPQLHRAASLRDAMRRLAVEKWDAVLLDLDHPPARELLAALKLHSVFHAVPAIALLASSDPQLEGAALSSGVGSCLAVGTVTAKAVQDAVLATIHSNKSNTFSRKGGQMPFLTDAPASELVPAGKIELISHALGNLLCIISANADILAEQVDGSQYAIRSVDQIKKATKTAAELTRRLKTR
jgi:CheY-like chemotaxis protein